MEKPKIKAPGLKWRSRKDRWVPYWIPTADASEAGYPSGSVNLGKLYDGSDCSAVALIDRCKALQAQMQLWMAGIRRNRIYDGTVGAALDLYESHADSPYQALKPSSRYPYEVYLRRLKKHVGGRFIRNVTGLDVKQWWKVWAEADAKGRNAKHLAAGSMAFRVLKEAVKFGMISGQEDCAKLFAVLTEITFPSPRPRKSVATAEQIIAARKEAHRLGRRSVALAIALQYETVLRLWDVIGQWYPIDYQALSDVLDGDRKWIGLEWRHIDSDMILRFTPSKTERTTGAEHAVDLKLCPMVLEELRFWPQDLRTGPIVIDERTDLPFLEDRFRSVWNRIRKNARLPEKLWARDIRASAVTEGRRGNASTDDASKVAAHSTARTTAAVYDRDSLEAHRRFAQARLSIRNQAGTSAGTSGNDSP